MKIFSCMFLAAAAAFAAKPVELKSSQLEVTFDPLKGLPVEYRLSSNKATMHGGAASEVTVTIFRANPRQFTTFAVRPEVIRSSKTRADFQFTVREKGAPEASFMLRYELSGAELLVSLEAVLEEQGFELIDVGLPELASVHEDDGGAWLAHGDGGGTFSMLSKAKPGHLPANRFWGGVAATLPVVMVGTNRMLCVEEVLSYMDTTELSVNKGAAALGTIKTWRVNGGLSYDMNTGPNTPRISGNRSTPNLMVGGRPLCRLDFSGDMDHNGVVDWLDGAKLVRARMPEIPTHYYDDKLLYMIRCDEPKFPKPQATFAESEKIIQRVASLTGGAPQDIYLWGWQYRGKDTGYPAVAEVNKRLGGFEGFEKLRDNARAMNATVSFSDNFDDAYQSSPAWDSNMVARRPDGELWQSRDWTGENSYILGLAKYMEGPGPERIRYTAERYKIRDTYLIDVLSYYTIRNDWDRERSASGVKNLLDGRFKVLEEFKKRGLDVVSEELRYATLGKISVSDNGPAGEESPFGGEAIPLIAAIYRKSAIWGMHGQEWKKYPELYSFFYNGHEFPWLPQEDWERSFAAFYYGTLVPWYQVHYRNIEAFLRDGDRTVISLEGNSRIDLDWKSDLYSITVNGVEVAKDGDTFCPIGKDRVAFYSRTAKQLSAPLPEGWDANAVVGRAMGAEKTEAANVSVLDGKLTVKVQAERPVMVFRDKQVRK
ncbi:MAG TPA: endo-alpha-N-acetylgalactosaminidase family protein [Bryobacteraceae bacterium]|nr:endo-alpha-N-acetylgalactosaminidase family protein [Bryobacteraceae bacterium]